MDVRKTAETDGAVKSVLDDLTLAAHRAYARGIQTGSGGNLSARAPDGQSMVVKASGGSFADCTAEGEGYISTDFDGAPLPGATGKPTREALLHGAIYKVMPEVGGVMHCHSPWAIAFSYRLKDLPMVTFHSELKFGCEIPVVNIQAPVVPQEELFKIEELFSKNPSLPAFILVGHGIVAVGKNAVDAEHAAEMVEETAQIAILKHLYLKQ